MSKQSTFSSESIEYKEINDIKQLVNNAQLHKYIKISNKITSQIGPGQIPEGVVGIVFGSNMNYEVSKKNLPSTLKYLNLGFSFNQDLTNLPNIEELTVGYSFKSKIKNVPNLKKLIIKSNYDRPLPYLPNTKIYMYDNNIGENVFKDYIIVMKPCKEKRVYVNNNDLMIIQMQTYKSCNSWCLSSLINIFCCT